MTSIAATSDAERRCSLLVRVIEFVLLANAVPAFIVLTSVPGRTADLFVWTITPDANARLLAAMYGNAAILALLAIRRRSWPQIRVLFVVFTLFSLAATIVTFFHLDPFLAHPRGFFVYWLCNYFFLFFTTPIAFVREERAAGGRLPIAVPLAAGERVIAAFAGVACLTAGIVLFAGPGLANHVWPWTLTPLVAHIIAVWLTALAFAYAWALWDGDRDRTRPIFVQGLPTAVLLGVIPLLYRDELTPGNGHRVLFAALVVALAASSVSGTRRCRDRPRGPNRRRR